MNDVKSQLLVDGVAKLCRLARRCLRADDDFPMVKSDDIGRSGDLHESHVDIGDDPVRDNGNFHLSKLLESELAVTGILLTFLQRQSGKPPQPRQAEPDGTLAVLDVDGEQGN